MAALRSELLEARMRRFRAGQRWGWTVIDAGLERYLATEAQAEQAQQQQTIATLDEAGLRTAMRVERMVQQRRAEREAAPRIKGPSPGM